MAGQEQLSDALVAHTVLAGQDERVCEQLLTDGADQLPLDALHRNLRNTNSGFSVNAQIPRASVRR